MSSDLVVPERRWWALVVLSITQLIIVLDATIVTISLPYAQADLGIREADKQWVLTAYTLMFGGLLLLGGRLADYLGRRRILVVGLVGFAAASALAGAATTGGALFAGRALQGVFAALLAPSALSLVSVTFTETRDRARAFAVFGGVSGAGLALGLIGGGALTEYTSWRWCLLINTPIALVTALVAVAVVVRDIPVPRTGSYDIPGVVTVTAALVATVYGFNRAAEAGWGAASTVVLLAAGAGLLAAFVVIESRVADPLLPLRIPGEINRGGAFLVALLAPVAIYAMFLFLSYYFQNTLGYSPLQAGLAFLPFPVGIVVSAGLASQLLPKVGPRPLMLSGALLCVVGLAYLAQLSVGDSYGTGVLPAAIVFALGMAQIFVAMQATAMHGIRERDIGVASGLLNAVQQIGAAIGTALLTTIAVQVSERYAQHHRSEPDVAARAAIHSYDTGFYWGAGFFLIAAMVIALTIRVRGRDLATNAQDAAVMVGQ
ncbi:MFS transporter [Nocardia mexicana]|uniref:EmrB/QacA subfamily drug resistance transporter n=1 Tax=Nocardia mexicana TaxID=279262 RepID=A0A370H9N4_9NOCA|nr:MFS transporter [Nocardia mexicana]RDI53377.1 EmrB/QacA subfamily drug resistance transporter [Nocardia mexicana]